MKRYVDATQRDSSESTFELDGLRLGESCFRAFFDDIAEVGFDVFEAQGGSQLIDVDFFAL